MPKNGRVVLKPAASITCAPAMRSSRMPIRELLSLSEAAEQIHERKQIKLVESSVGEEG